MRVVKLVDENGKEIKVDENNVNQFVILNAVELTKKTFPTKVAFLPTEKASFDPCSMDEFTNVILDRYNEKGLFNNNSNIPQSVKTTAFASMRAAQIIYNLSIAQEIKSNIDELVDEREFKKLKPQVFEEAKRQIDETIDKLNYTGVNKEFVDSVTKTFNEYSDTHRETMRFLGQSINYVDRVSKNVFDEDYDIEEDLVFREYKGKDLDGKMALKLHGVVSEYVNQFKENLAFGLSYGKGDVKPFEFLEHYRNNPDSLTEKEKNWAENTYRRLEDMVAGKQMTMATKIDRVDITDFKADGVQIVSEEEAKRETDHTKLEAKIIAAMLSGKEITSQPKVTKDMPVQINPSVYCTKPESILDQIIEIIMKLFDRETDKDKVQAMNDSFNKYNDDNTKIGRQKMGFDELTGNTYGNKVNAPAKKEEPENVVTITRPTFGR